MVVIPARLLFGRDKQAEVNRFDVKRICGTLAYMQIYSARGSVKRIVRGSNKYIFDCEIGILSSVMEDMGAARIPDAARVR